MAASDAASGTCTIRSITGPTKLGSTRGRPMPSIREPTPVVTVSSPAGRPAKNAEFSGSATHSRVAWRR